MSLSNKYREFHRNNQYSYSGLFMAIGFGKFIIQIGVVFAAAWYSISLVTGPPERENVLAQKSPAVDMSLQAVGLANEAEQGNFKRIEIPATATSDPIPVVVSTDSALSVGVYNADWLLKQDASSFVVQLASSTDKPDLYQKAFDLSDGHPVVVFPFKKVRGNRLMYGYAIGMYGSFQEARRSVSKLPEGAVAEGVWIRLVGDLQKDIVSTRF